MERRVLIAIFLSFLVLYVYQTYVVKPVPKTAKTAADLQNGPGVPLPPESTATAQPTSPVQPPVAEAPVAAALVGDTNERDIRVETTDVVAVFTNRGAK